MCADVNRKINVAWPKKTIDVIEAIELLEGKFSACSPVWKPWIEKKNDLLWLEEDDYISYEKFQQ